MFSSLDQFLGPFYFGLFALAAVACAGGVAITRHPLHGAVCLIGAMIALAGIYGISGAPFLGVLQVLVYAGAIMMLVVFVIMVLNKGHDHDVPGWDALALATMVAPLLITGLVIFKLAASAEALAFNDLAMRGEVQEIAPRLFNVTAAGPGWYLLFLLIGVVLLVAVAAAVLLAKHHLDAPEAAQPAKANDHAH